MPLAFVKRLQSRLSFLTAQKDISLVLAARVGLLSFALISVFFSTLLGSESADSLSFIYVPIIGLYAISGLSALWLMWYPAGAIFTWLQLSIDIAIITGVIYITGGTISPFLFLYFLPVMAASIVASRRTALIVAAISGAAYTTLSVSLYKGWILTADGSPLVESSSSPIVLQIVGLCSALVLVAVLTSFLASKIRLSDLLIRQSKQDLSALNSRQQALMDGFPEGIITTQLDETVVTINHAATELLGLSAEQLIGKNLSSALSTIDSHFAGNKLELDRKSEFEVANAANDDVKKIVYRGRRIFNEAGNASSLLFVFQDVTKLRSIEEQLEMQERMARLLAAKVQPDKSKPVHMREFIGESPIMQKIFALIQRVSNSDATVLISGESGTGKELVAKSLHHGSPRAHGPFVALNCGAIPENLIESELFGHKKGSFTGADSDSPGLFRQAEGGTIFLDEIGELPLQMQAKLLRAIQEKRVRPIGGDRDTPINTRIVAATNRNLKKEIEAGNFREDLYYRLNVINISLPPLRDRKEDIPLLAHSCIQRLLDADTNPVISPGAMQLLLNYNYPGNVRELENILERALVLGGEVILPEHLTDTVRGFDENAAANVTAQVPGMRPETLILVDENIEFPVDLDELLGKIERHYLEVALLRTSGAKKKAADLLGMNFRSFRYRLQKFGMSSDAEE